MSWERGDGLSKKLRSRIEEIARDLTPKQSRVTIKRLQAGHSGAEVFRLGVTDQHNAIEVPRVLKLGRFEEVKKELLAYVKFVNNKHVGHACRVDTARAYHFDNDDWGAIVYLLVGAGEKASPWSEWAVRLDHSRIEAGLSKLYEQLSLWYGTTRPVQHSAVELLIARPFFQEGLKLDAPGANHPTSKEVIDLLRRLSNRNRLGTRGHTNTSVVHGDLHTGNVFSLLNGSDERLEGVALIDWGNVSAERHPLGDIAKLMADLFYKVRWGRAPKTEEKKWAFKVVQKWGEDLKLKAASDSRRPTARLE